MKLRQSCRRHLSRILIGSMLLVLFSGCFSSLVQLADRDGSLVGKYTYTEREAASEIELHADGTFTYTFVYGALDEGANGTWKSTAQNVTLKADYTKQEGVTPPPTDMLELRRDERGLVLSRQSSELLYIRHPEQVLTDFNGKMPKGDRRIPVDIIGYNYTNQYIESFNVNGYGGGNVSLSTATSGGGSQYCCYYFMPGVGFPFEVEVEWTPSGRNGPWTKTKALIPEPKTDRPKYLQIHFYPDGHIEGELSDDYSPPRLKLTKKNANER
jgi:hypothetical protein